MEKGEDGVRVGNKSDEGSTGPPPQGEPVTNVISFDLEHWHSATLVREHVSNPRDWVEESVERVLELLSNHDVTATFFVVGEVAREYPGVLERIADADHEIATHGDTHTPLSALNPETFVDEIERSCDAIERVTGYRPRGFRAPNFSLGPPTAWAMEELAAAGFTYDASVFPVRTPMYGVSGAPIHPYRLNPEAPFRDHRDTVESKTDQMIELPAAVFHPQLKIPIAGGFYGRVLPRRLLTRGIRNLNARGIPATLYFHPWEFNPEVPIEHLPKHKEFVSFYGIEKLAGKLDTLLTTFPFDTAESVAATYNDDDRQEIFV